METQTTTITQTSGVALNAQIRLTYETDNYVCRVDKQVIDDEIETVDLTLTPKAQPQNVIEPKIGYYARANWNKIGQSSYYFSNEVATEERALMTAVIDAVIALICSEHTKTFTTVNPQ